MPVFDTGIPRIDQLLNDPAAPALAEGTRDPAVGIVHDWLNRFDPKLVRLRPLLPAAWTTAKPAPLPSLENYTLYGPKTTALVRAFQRLKGLTVSGQVDPATTAALLAAEESKRLITPAELIFTHDLKYTHFVKAVVLTGGKECRFDFTVMNRNTDAAGLSLGVLHWAQKPKRLVELIVFLRLRSPDFLGTKFMDALFGGTADMERVIAHLERGAEGLHANGLSKDPTLEFAMPAGPVAKYWPSCFECLVGAPFAQGAMVEMAIKTFRKLYDSTYPDYPGNQANLLGRNLRVYAPKLVSERAVIFGLDMINQHGGRVRTLYEAFVTQNPGATERQIMEALRDGAHAFWLSLTSRPMAVREKFAAADTDRRNYFINTANLSEVPFDPA